MASPTRSDYDADLSTLTNIRINNRKSKQRLLNKVLSDQTNHFNNINLDTSSPLKSYSPPKRTQRSPAQAKEPRYELDPTILSKENQRFLDDDLYSLDRHLNELKKERFLNKIVSPESSIHGRRSFRSPKKDASIYSFKERDEDTFKNYKKHHMNSSIPNLKPTESNQNFSFPSPNSIRRKREFYRNSDVFRNFKDLNLKDHKKEDDDADLILDDANDVWLKDDNDIKELKLKVTRLEQELSLYRSKMKHSSPQNKEVQLKFKSLRDEINELNKFINFLEQNFDKIYKKSHYYKLEKHDLHKTNQELLFINSFYKQQLAKYEKLERVEEKHDRIEDQNDSTTYHLMKFQSLASEGSERFKKLSSIKKFKVVGFLVLSIIKMKKRASQHEKFYRKLSEYTV